MNLKDINLKNIDFEDVLDVLGLQSKRNADFFLPASFRYYGIRLSTDTRYAREYTRAWRPYATIAKTWHSDLGPGYDLGAGIAGNLFGADHLNFGWKLGKGGAISGGLVREVGLSYRLHY